jgi:hypothetical protein
MARKLARATDRFSQLEVEALVREACARQGVDFNQMKEAHAVDIDFMFELIGLMTERALAQEVAHCAATLEISNKQLLQLAGELTSSEIRAVQAVLTNRSANLRARAKASSSAATPAAPAFAR